MGVACLLPVHLHRIGALEAIDRSFGLPLIHKQQYRTGTLTLAKVRIVSNNNGLTPKVCPIWQLRCDWSFCSVKEVRPGFRACDMSPKPHFWLDIGRSYLSEFIQCTSHHIYGISESSTTYLLCRHILLRPKLMWLQHECMRLVGATGVSGPEDTPISVELFRAG